MVEVCRLKFVLRSLLHIYIFFVLIRLLFVFATHTTFRTKSGFILFFQLHQLSISGYECCDKKRWIKWQHVCLSWQTFCMLLYIISVSFKYRNEERSTFCRCFCWFYLCYCCGCISSHSYQIHERARFAIIKLNFFVCLFLFHFVYSIRLHCIAGPNTRTTTTTTTTTK